MKQQFLILQRDTDYGSLVAGASSLASTAINAAAAGDANRRGVAYAWDMYNQQRTDALTDLQNANYYNSPKDQMRRLKEAGLNPNLVYGKGAGDMASAPIRGSNAPTPNIRPIDYSGIGDTIGKYFNTKLMQSQLLNQEAQNNLLAKQAGYVDAQTQSTLAGIPKINVEIDTANFDLDLKRALRDVTERLKHGELTKQIVDTNYVLDNSERQAISNSASVYEALTRVLNLNAERANTVAEKTKIAETIKSLRNDNTLKELDIELIKNSGNINRPHDGIMSKIIGYLLGKTNEGYDRENKK